MPNDNLLIPNPFAESNVLSGDAPAKPEAEDAAQAAEGEEEQIQLDESDLDDSQEAGEESAQPEEESATEDKPSEFTPIEVNLSPTIRNPEGTKITIESREKLEEMAKVFNDRENWQKAYTTRDQELAKERKYYDQFKPLLETVQRFKPGSDEYALMDALTRGYSAAQIYEAITGKTNDPEPNKQEDYGGWLEWKQRQLERRMTAPQPKGQDYSQQMAQDVIANNEVILMEFVAELKGQYGEFMPSQSDQDYFTDNMLEELARRGYDGVSRVIPKGVYSEIFAAKFPELINRKKGVDKAKEAAAKRGRNLGTSRQPSSAGATRAKERDLGSPLERAFRAQLR
jgi:hypothetical protein